MFHTLLQRQLKKAQLSEEAPPPNKEEWNLFLDRVSKTYQNFDDERYLLERSLNISSQEMQERWNQIQEQRVTIFQAAKMATLGEMAGGIAHEINNPLAVIGGSASLLKNAFSEEKVNRELADKYIASINKMVERIAKIVIGLRSFSRDGSKDPFIKTSIKSIVEETLSLCQTKLSANKVELRVSSMDESLKIDCRATEISQIILNIVSNSIDAILDQPVKWIQMDIFDEDSEIMIRIIDSGSGIPIEIQDKIFQPFFTTKPVGKGTGLGLSIAMGVAKSHSGSLTIDNTSPNTCFVLLLPKSKLATK